MTLDEVIGREMATITAPLDEVVEWMLAEVRVRPGFRELVAEHEPLIVSAGFHETIDPILRREGVDARVVANHVTADPSGWRSTFPAGPTCEVCGERCKRAAVAAHAAFAYAGDGISDRCVSLAAERRFARAGLAAWLDERASTTSPSTTSSTSRVRWALVPDKAARGARSAAHHAHAVYPALTGEGSGAREQDRPGRRHQDLPGRRPCGRRRRAWRSRAASSWSWSGRPVAESRPCSG